MSETATNIFRFIIAPRIGRRDRYAVRFGSVPARAARLDVLHLCKPGGLGFIPSIQVVGKTSAGTEVDAGVIAAGTLECSTRRKPHRRLQKGFRSAASLSKTLALAVVSLLIVVWINERFSHDFRKSNSFVDDKNRRMSATTAVW